MRDILSTQHRVAVGIKGCRFESKGMGYFLDLEPKNCQSDCTNVCHEDTNTRKTRFRCNTVHIATRFISQKVHIATHNDDYKGGGFRTYTVVKYRATVIDTYRLSRGMSRACPCEACLDNNALHSANVLAPPPKGPKGGRRIV